MGYVTPSGHHPIPAIGARVRVYLERGDDSWRVVLPNGITSVGHANDVSAGSLHDAPEVTQLRSRRYTYVLPIELWILLVFPGFPILLAGTFLGRWFRRRRLRQRMSKVTEQSHALDPAAGSDSIGEFTRPNQ